MPESNDKSTSFYINRSLQCGDKIITFDKPKVMGILNLTPDSFYDGGRYQQMDQYIEQSERMLNEGADILDLGAVSTRPGAVTVSENEELNRLIPALQEIVKRFPQTIISVDTFRSNVAKMAAENGACIINDISCGKLDSNMIQEVAKLKLPYVLMHMQGTPATMQINPEYQDVVGEIHDFFREEIRRLQQSGVTRIVLDPGFGFGKTIEHNFRLLKRLEKFRDFGFPILVGVSRKSMINKLLNIRAEESLHATDVLHTLAILGGADILRVHDVREAMQVIKVVETYQNTAV